MVQLLSGNADRVFITVVAVMFTIGVILLITDDIKLWIRKIMLRRSLQSRKRKRREQNWIEKHLEELFQLLPESKRINPIIFAVCSLILGAIVLYVTAWTLSLGLSLLFSAVSGLVPYVILRIRCEIVRSKVSGEGSKMISILLSAYRMNGENISEALEFTAAQKEEIPETSPVLKQMVMRLRESENDLMIGRAIESFISSVNSNWAKMLGADIRLAYTEGAGISLALEEVLNQLREAEILMEERIRLNNESSRMTVFMIPIAFILTFFMAIKQLDIPLVQLIKNQFSDGASTTMFMIMMLLFIFNLAAGEIIKHKKLDI